VHSEICAVPAERLVVERELLAVLPSLRNQHAPLGRLTSPYGDRLAGASEIPRTAPSTGSNPGCARA
jgi:hypothetical protein